MGLLGLAYWLQSWPGFVVGALLSAGASAVSGFFSSAPEPRTTFETPRSALARPTFWGLLRATLVGILLLTVWRETSATLLYFGPGLLVAECVRWMLPLSLGEGVADQTLVVIGVVTPVFVWGAVARLIVARWRRRRTAGGEHR